MVGFQFRPTILEPDLVLLEESVQLVRRFETKQSAQLAGRQFMLTVDLKSDGFKSGSRKCLVRCS